MSLRARLLVSMIGVAVVALVVAGLVARTQTRADVESFIESYTTDDDAIRIDEYYVENGSWDGVADLLLAIGDPYDERLILTGENDEVIADSHPDEPLPTFDDLFGDVEFVFEGEEPTVLYTLGRTTTPVRDETLASLDRWLLVAGVVALAVAAIAAVVSARRLAHPLAALHAGVDAVQRGALDHRIAESGPPEIARVASAVNTLAHDLDRSIRHRKAMTADLAHELRTPVANLQAYVEGMIDGVAEPSGDDLQIVHGEVLRLHRLIGQLQELSLADAGQLTLHRHRHDLTEIARTVVTLAEARAGARSIELRVSGLPVVADVDGDRIQQVLANLVDNAIRHSPEAGVVEVSVSHTDDRGHVSVRDHGGGIPADQLDAVFERLHRADPARTGRDSGAGLGLAIARSFVELHGGSIRAENADGGGAQFAFDVPLA